MIGPGAAPLALAALLASGAATQSGYLERLETLALIEQLNGELLASRSATVTLEHWCAVHGMASPARLSARRDRSAARPATLEQRQHLQVGPSEVLGYRHVQLVCGGHVLSEADNWFVPSRLSAEMNRALEETDTPFGRVILPLQVQRQTLSVERLWSPLPPDWAVAPVRRNDPAPAVFGPLFRHHALLVTPAGLPIAEVEETYSSQALDFRRHGETGP